MSKIQGTTEQNKSKHFFGALNCNYLKKKYFTAEDIRSLFPNINIWFIFTKRTIIQFVCKNIELRSGT